MSSPERRPKIRSTFLVFGQPLIEEPEMAEVLDSMRAAWLGTGPKVARFEREFAAYKGVSRAVALNSCTAGLHLACLALNLQPGDEIITTPMTFCATVNAIIHAGGRPVLADVDPDTMNIDPTEVERAVTPRTRAILPVHFAGRACDMDRIQDIAERHGLVLIEDCAHAIETEYRGRKAGTIGDFGCFSFYSTKNVVTGEGGMVLTRNAKDADRIKVLGLHGMSQDAWKRFSDEGFKHYDVVAAGFKYNMMDLQASIGIHQLARVEENWNRRAMIWKRYNEAFGEVPVGLPAPVEAGMRHAYHLYTVLIDEARAGISRDGFLAGMTRQNIGVGVHYRSIPEHPYYAQTFGWKAEQYPHAYRIGRQTVSLPISPKLSDQDVEDVIRAVTTLVGRGSSVGKAGRPHRLNGWRKEAVEADGLKDCSLVVATYRRPREIVTLLDTLIGLPDPPGEVAIVDGSPEDEAGKAISSWARPRTLPFDLLYVKSPAGLTRQRNAGIDASSREFVFFLDDDCRPLPGYFQETRKVFLEDRDGKVGAVCGSIINEMDQPLSWRWRLRFALRLVPRGEPGAYYPTATSIPRSLERAFSRLRPIDVMPGCAMAYRRAVFSRHRFSEFFSGYAQGEDVEMSRRVARDWKLLSCGDAHVIHDHAEHGRPDGFRRGRMVARNRYFIWKRHSPGATPKDQLKFWLDQAFIAVYHAGYFLTHPTQMANLFYVFGVVFGAVECAVSPPCYEEPVAARQFEFWLETL